MPRQRSAPFRQVDTYAGRDPARADPEVAVEPFILCRDYGVFQMGGNRIGRDHTVFAKADGEVKFEVKGQANRKTVSILVH